MGRGVYVLTCASCGTTTAARGASSFDAYQRAAHAGWDVAGRLDYCRRCAASKPAAPSKRAPSRRR